MKHKSTEELLLDFFDRFEACDFALEIDKREINKDDNLFVLWFKVQAKIYLPEYSLQQVVYGESYTFDKAIGQMSQNAMQLRKPKIWPRRELVVEHQFSDMENIVKYNEKSGA